MGFSWQECCSGLPFLPPVARVFSELSTITSPSLMALHGTAHSFTEIYKPFHHNKAVSMKESHDKPRQRIKQRHHFPNKGPHSQSYGFSSCHVRMSELDHKQGWVPKNLPSQILWTRFFRVPWTVKTSNQSILKEINPEYPLEGLLKLKLQYFGHLVWRTDSFEKTWCWERLKVGREWDDRGLDGWMVSPTQWTWVWTSSRVGDGQRSLACCSPWGHKELDTTELNWVVIHWTNFTIL